jgi:hypothetical protein
MEQDTPAYTHFDPEITDALRAAASTASLLGAALSRLGPAHLEAVPDDDESWSAVETVGQLLDQEVLFGHRLRAVLSESSPRLETFDKEQAVVAQRWRSADLSVLLEAWSGLRRAHLALISRLDSDQLSRGGAISTQGSVTTRDLVLRLPVQDRLYLSRLGQLEEKLLRPLA